MASKKARGKKQTPKQKQASREPEGFDDVDDFFFGSETGSFARDEFDYDPFDDPSSVSGRHKVPPAELKSTRMVMEVPSELTADQPTRPQVDAKKPPAKAKAKAKAKPKPKGRSRARAKAKKETAPPPPPPPPVEEEATIAPKAAAPEEPAELPESAAAALPDDPSDLPEAPTRSGDIDVPLSERRAAGTAELARMELDDQLFVGGDEEDEGAANVPDAAAAPTAEPEPEPEPQPEPEPRKSSTPAPAAAVPPPAPVADAPVDSELPGASEWALAVSELTAEADALSTKKTAGRRAALLFEVGRILARRVGDWTGAEARWEAALQASDKFLPALRELVRLCASREDWKRSVDLLGRQAKAARDPASKTSALLASAHIQLSQLDQLKEASTALQKALDAAPDNYIALRFLREIHYRTQSWNDLVEVLRRAREIAGAGEQIRIDYELGRLHDEVLKGPADAIGFFRACLSGDGRYIPALLAAERLLEESGDVAGTLDLWRGAAAAWGGADASFWYARAARAGDAASLPKEKVDSDYREAVATSPCPEVLSEEYRHWLESSQRWDELAAALEDAADAEESPQLKAGLLTDLARIALEQAGDAQAAAGWLDKALAADPTCIDASDAKRQALAAAADWDGVLSLLAARGEASSTPRVKLAINLKMAEVAEVQLDDLPSARLHLEAACLLAPNYLPALDALIDVLDRLDDARGVAERLEQAATLVDSGEAEACYHLRSSLAWTRAGVRDRSIMALQKAAKAGPGALLAREGLVHEYVADGRWAEAAETLRQAAAETEDAALKVSLLYRSGRIYLARANDEDAAEASYRSLLDLVPDFLPAMMDLRDIYTGRGDWDAYGLLQQQEAEGSEDEASRVWWHLSGGRAYERAGRVEDAIAQYRAALEVDSSSAVANAALRRVYRNTSDSSALAESYGRQLRGTTDGKLRDALRVQLISAMQAMGDAGGVGTEVSELLKSDGLDDVPVAATAIIAEGMQLWDQAIAAYAAVGDHKGLEASSRAACLFQQGLLLEEVREESAAAADLYGRVVELVPGHAMALEGLERVHSTAGDGGALASVYAQEAAAAGSQPVQTFYALLAGEQFENLGDAAAAIDSYRMALGDPVGRERAFDALRRLALESRDVDVLDELTLGVADLSDDNDAISRWMELGEGLAAANEDERATTALEAVLERQADFLPAMYHLERVHADREDWNAVLAVLERISDTLGTDGAKSAVDGRIQELLQDRGVTSDSAFDFYKKLHEREPENLVAIKGLGGIHLSRGEASDAKGYFEMFADKAADPVSRAEAETQLAALALELGEGDEAAVARLEKAIEHEGTHRPALEALKEIHARTENWSALVGVLARESSLAPEDRRLPYFIEIAQLWDHKIGNAKVAVSSWSKVLQEKGDQPEAIERLLALHSDSGDWSAYLDVADRGLASLSGADLRNRRAELGTIAREKARDLDRAVGYLRAATAGESPHPEALAQLRSIARSRGDWEQVIQLCEQEVEVAPDTETKVRLLEEAARIKLDQLLDRDGAAGLYKRAIGLDDTCGSALSFFTDYYFDTEQWEDALPVFRNFEPVIETMDLEEDDDARIEATGFFYKFGVVLSQAGEEDDALARFARALELTPTHLPSLEAASPRYFEADDWGRARETSRAILRLRGGTGDSVSMTRLYLRLGNAELELGEQVSALKRFKKALDRTPNHVPALQGIARIHRIGEDWNSLLSTYNSIIKYARDPDQVIQAYMTKGDVLESKLQFTDKAVLHYEKVLMYDKTNWSATARLCQIALQRGDVDKASEFADRASGSAGTVEEKACAALLSKLSSAADELEVGPFVEQIRKDLGGEDGGVLDSFRALLGSDERVARSAAAEAARGALPHV